MSMSVMLVHSPLVGPSSWVRTADELRRRGFDVAVPDLTAVAEAPAPRWEVFVERATLSAEALTGDIAVVGHSGAGAFLPAIAGRLEGRVAALLFVDAVVPPATGVHETPPELHALLDEQTIDGRLRRWLEWWPADVLAELVPDLDDRAALLADMPSLPRSFYDEPVPVPEGWTNQRCAYLKLSAAYDAEHAEAGQRGWPRLELDADHLAIRTRPAPVADAIGSLLGRSNSTTMGPR